MTKKIKKNLRDLQKKCTGSKYCMFVSLIKVSLSVQSSFMLAEYLKSSNYEWIFPKQLIFTTLLVTLTSIILAIIAFIATHKNHYLVSLTSVILMSLFVVDYSSRLANVTAFFRTFTPILPAQGDDIPFISLLFLSLLCILSIYIGKLFYKVIYKNKNLEVRNIVYGLYIGVFLLLIGQLVPSLKILAQVVKQSNHIATSELTQAKKDGYTSTGNKPDIYYIVLDRYANNSVLKSNFGYDNSEFLNSLRNSGFNVKDDALSQYPYTSPSITSTINMKYLDDDLAKFSSDSTQSQTLFHNMIRQAQAVKLLKNEGYNYYNIGSSFGMTNKAPLATADLAIQESISLFGNKKTLREIEQSQFNQSIFHTFSKVRSSWWPLKSTQLGWIDYTKQQLAMLKDFSNKQNSSGNFIFAHLLLPHPHYVFNADGSASTNIEENNNGKMVQDKYLDQLKFANSQIKEITDNILKNTNNNAVILLIADEGPYPWVFNTNALSSSFIVDNKLDTYVNDMQNWPIGDLKIKYGMLQAVYMPNINEEDITSLAPVNAFRIILNKYFGYTYPYLPACQKGLNGSSTEHYTYSDITYKFTDTKSDVCTK